MSKLVSLGLALALGLAVASPASAGHRYCGCYGSYYSPTYSSYYGYGSNYYGSNYATYYSPTSPVVTTTPAPAAGPVAQSQNGVYRSFSDEPGQAAAATISPSAPMQTFAVPAAPAPASDYDTIRNPYGSSPVTIGGAPGPASNYGTAGNPYGSGITTYGGVYNGASTGGTAGHPY